MQIPFFVPAGCFSIPQLGRYEQSDYEILPYRLLIELPFESAALSDHLPHHILNELDSCSNGQELYIIWYDTPSAASTSSGSPVDLNVLFHPWIFRDADTDLLYSDEGTDCPVKVGGWTEWLGQNVEEAPAAPEIPPPLAGLPMNRFDSRLVSMHSGSVFYRFLSAIFDFSNGSPFSGLRRMFSSQLPGSIGASRTTSTCIFLCLCP